MKLLRSLLALCAFALSATFASADSLDLDTDYFYTDSTEPNLQSSYHVFGYGNDDYYSVGVDYFFNTLDLDSVMFEVWFIDDTESVYLGDSTYGGGIEHGEDFSFLDLSLELPSDTPGTLYVAVTFYFSDSTQLTETLSSPID